MTLDEVVARLVGRTIVAAEASRWDEGHGWLDHLSLRLDDGTELDALDLVELSGAVAAGRPS